MKQNPQHELLLISVLGTTGLLLSSGLLASLESPRFALHWLLLSCSCWVLVIWQCRKRLSLNRRAMDTPLHASLGMANQITLVRGWLIAGTAGFIFNRITHSYIGFIPALLYTTAALSDALDGYLARRQQRITLLGTEMDTLVDALGLVIAPLVAVIHGKVQASYLLVSAAYYLFQWGLRRRRLQGKPIHPLPPSSIRRTMAGFQMGFVAAALYPPVQADMSRAYGMAFMLPLLAGFWLDWRSVSSDKGTVTGFVSSLSSRLASLDYSGVMVFVRAALITALLWALLGNKLQNFPHFLLPLFGQSALSDLPAPTLLQTLFFVLFWLCMLGIVLGTFGRSCAVLLMAILSWQFPFLELDLCAWVAIFGTVLTALFGSGRLSLHTGLFSPERYKGP